MLAKMGFKPGSQGLGKNNQGSVATKILEERSVKSLVEVENLYQSSTIKYQVSSSPSQTN